MEPKLAPYAPPSAVLRVIRHYRLKDPPEYLTTTNLRQLGVTEALVNRTLVALKFLGLVREDGTTTDEIRALRYANDDEYQTVLGGILDAAYKEVFDHIDLESAGDRELNNAFIPYSPGQQRSRMITLFLELAREAGREIAVQAKPSASQSAKPMASKVSVKLNSKQVRQRARQQIQQPQQQAFEASPAGAVAFGITDADLAALPASEFDAVWTALGKLARARAEAARDKARSKSESNGGDGGH